MKPQWPMRLCYRGPIAPWFRSRKVRIGLVVLGLVVGLFGWFKSPGYRFPPPKHLSAERLADLVDLDDALSTAEASAITPGDADIPELDRWVRDSSNAGAPGWPQLVRSLPPEWVATEPEAAERLAVMNSLILNVHADGRFSTPAELVAMPSEGSQRTLASGFARLRQTKLRQSYRSLLDQHEVVQLLDTAGWSLPPTRAGASLRERARALIGFSPHLELWVDEFRAACDVPREDLRWLGRVKEASDFSLSATGEIAFVLRPVPSTNDKFDIRSRVAARNCKLSYRFSPPAEAGSQRTESSTETGIRLLGVPVSVGESGLVYDAERANRLVIDVEEFHRFLASLSLPAGLTVSEVRPRKGATAAADYVIGLRVRHPALPAFSHGGDIEIDLSSASQLPQRIAAFGETALRMLDQHLATATEFGGWKIRFAPIPRLDTDESTTARFRCELEVADELKLPLLAQRLPDGGLVFANAPSASASDAAVGPSLVLRDYLCRRVAVLRDQTPLVRIDRWQLVSQGQRFRLQGRLSTSAPIDPTNGAGAITTRGGEWEVLRSGNAVAVLDPVAAEADLRPHLLPSGSPMASVAERLALDAAVRDELALNYSKVARYIRPHELEPLQDGYALNATLQIADWPPVTLGPVRLRSLSDTRPAVASLLGMEHVSQAAARAWGGEVGAIEHPHFGPIRSELKQWDATTGLAKIACELPIYQPEDPRQQVIAGWDEALSADHEGELWTADDRDLQGRLGLWVAGLGSGATALARQATGLDISVDVDRDGFGPGKWLQRNPPAISLKGSVRPFSGYIANMIPSSLDVSKLRVDRDGVSFGAADIGVAKQGTMMIPGPVPFAISDPKMIFNVQQKKVGVGIRITPPTVPLGTASLGSGGGEAAVEDFVQGAQASAEQVADSLSDAGIRDRSGSWRLDNLWLNLLSLDSELSYAHGGRRIAGRSELDLFGEERLAEGSLGLGLENLEVDGQVAGNSNRLGRFSPRFNGKISANAGGKGGFEVGTEMALASLHLRGKIDHQGSRAANPKRPVQIRGSVKIPFYGATQFAGDSDPMFREPRVSTAKATTVDGVPVKQMITLSESGYEVISEWKNGQGESVSRAVAGPVLDEAAFRGILDQLRDEIPMTLGRNLSLTGDQLSRLPRLTGRIRYAAEDSGSDVDDVPPQPATDGEGVRPSGQIRRRIEGAHVVLDRCVESHRDLSDQVVCDRWETFLDCPPSVLGIGLNDSELKALKLNYWRIDRDGSLRLLVFHPGQQSAQCLRIDRATEVTGDPEDLRGFAEFFRDSVRPLLGYDPLATALAGEVLVSWVSLNLAGYETEFVARSGNRATIRWTVPDPLRGGQRMRLYLPDRSGTAIQTVALYDWLVPAAGWTGVVDAIVQSGPLPIGFSKPALVQATAVAGRFHVGLLVGPPRSDPVGPAIPIPEDAFQWVRLQTYVASGSGGEPTVNTWDVAELRGAHPRRRIAQLARVDWAVIDPAERLLVVVGDDGLVLLREGPAGWEIEAFPGDATIGAGGGTDSYTISQQEFESLDDPTGELLVPEWLAADDRRGVSGMAVAQAMVTDWQTNRLRWPARPIEVLRPQGSSRPPEAPPPL